MQRSTRVIAISGLAVVLACAMHSSVSAHTYFGFQIGIGGAPPPPRVVFLSPPPMMYEPESRVYVMRDDDEGYDTFRYGSRYYVCNDGYWYRSRSYRGPFVVVDVRYVPEPIFRVPERRWRHYPQGLGHWRASQGQGQGQGHGHGHGHGRTHGHDSDH